MTRLSSSSSSPRRRELHKRRTYDSSTSTQHIRNAHPHVITLYPPVDRCTFEQRSSVAGGWAFAEWKLRRRIGPSPVNFAIIDLTAKHNYLTLNMTKNTRNIIYQYSSPNPAALPSLATCPPAPWTRWQSPFHTFPRFELVLFSTDPLESHNTCSAFGCASEHFHDACFREHSRRPSILHSHSEDQ